MSDDAPRDPSESPAVVSASGETDAETRELATLSGAAPRRSFRERLVAARPTLSFLAPWLAIGLALAIAGALTLDEARRATLGDWRFGLPLGLILLAAIATVLRQVLHVRPSLTIERFALDGSRFEFVTPRHGRRVRAISRLVRIVERRTRRGATGWRLDFVDGERVLLDRATPHADALVERLKPHARYLGE